MSDETQRAEENAEKAANTEKTPTPAEQKQDQVSDETS
ncbi:MAG: hypothetical protein V7605_913 [Acidimicrobiaceae bacterium]|jgi:hypothetical protein